MKSVIQRVKKAEVMVNGKVVGQIRKGLLVLLAVHKDDTEERISKMADKILNLRIFSDEQDKMNLSVKDVEGEILVVSQFTLYADCQKGSRPGFSESAKPEKAEKHYKEFIKYLRSQSIKVETGEFGEMMEVELVNDGPVTLILDF